jgi:hypothetical protein
VNHKLNSGGGHNGEHVSKPGNNNSLHYRDKKQNNNGCMSENTRDQMCHLQVDQPVGCLWTFNLHTKNVHHLNTPPMPGHLSLLGGETHPQHPLLFQNSPLIFSDAVDLDPSVKIIFNTVAEREHRKGFKFQVVSLVMGRIDEMMQWLSYLKVNCKDPNYLHNHNISCTYKDIVKKTQGVNKTYLNLYVVIFSPDQAEHPD